MPSFQQSMTINVRSNGAKDVAEQVREVSRSVFEAKTLLNVPLKLKLNVSDFEASARRARDGLSGLASSVRTFNTLLIGTGIERFAKFIVDGVDNLTTLENRIKTVSGANDEFAFTFARLTAIANETRTSLVDITQAYQRVSRATADLGGNQATALEFTKDLNLAIKLGGSTSQEAKQGMIQLTQAMSLGVLRGQDLRSVLEELPGVAKAIAEHFGITVGQLHEFGIKGKITAVDMVQAIIEQGQKLDQQFKDMTPTFEQSWEVFQNSWMKGLKLLQPLLTGTTKVLQGLVAEFEALGDMSDIMSKRWEAANRGPLGAWGHLGELLDSRVGMAPGDKNLYQTLVRKHKERVEANKDEDMIQRGEAMLNSQQLVNPPIPTKGHKEGGLTFAELIYKMKQEQEVASMTPFESDVTKEFFEKMDRLKKSTREDLVTHAGKGGKQDEELRQLQDMIRLEHELAEAQKFVRYWDEKIEEEKKKRMQISIDLGKKEQEARAENLKKIYESDRAIKESLDPFRDYNKEIEKFNDYLYRHPEDIQKVTTQVEKLGYAYQTFAPVFQQMSDGLADASANAIVFGNNFSQALKQIAQASAASMISSLIKTGIGVLIGTPMAGLNGGSPLTPGSAVSPTGTGRTTTGVDGVVTTHVGANQGILSKAQGGYVPGYEFGGYTGSYARGDIAGVVHGQEFVVNANATARNRAMLESMNSGKPVGTASVNIHNYAGVAVDASADSNGNVEVMIHRAINDRVPAVVAQDLRNRNGKVAKALRQNYDINKRN